MYRTPLSIISHAHTLPRYLLAYMWAPFLWLYSSVSLSLPLSPPPLSLSLSPDVVCCHAYSYLTRLVRDESPSCFLPLWYPTRSTLHSTISLHGRKIIVAPPTPAGPPLLFALFARILKNTHALAAVLSISVIITPLHHDPIVHSRCASGRSHYYKTDRFIHVE